MASLFYLLPGAIIGAILSYILPLIVGAVRHFIRIFRHQRTAEGQWYSYHYTRRLHEPKIRQMQWRIKEDFRGHFAVICQGGALDRAPSARQKGTAISERGHLLIRVYKPDDHHHATCLIPEPVVFNETTGGLWLGFDLDGRPITGPIIFSREELAVSEAESLLKERVSANAAFRLLELAKPRPVRKA
jgi:hypothetical protein